MMKKNGKKFLQQVKLMKEKGNWILNSADNLVLLIKSKKRSWKYNNQKIWDEGGFLPYWNINKDEILNNVNIQIHMKN